MGKARISEVSKIGKTLARFKEQFEGCSDVQIELQDEARILKEYQESLDNFKSEFPHIDDKIARFGFTPALMAKLFFFADKSEKNQFAVDLFRLKTFPDTAPSYKEARKRIFNELDRIYCEDPYHGEFFVQCVLEALEGRYSIKQDIARTASALELNRVSPSVAELIKKIKNQPDLIAEVAKEEEHRAKIYDDVNYEFKRDVVSNVESWFSPNIAKIKSRSFNPAEMQALENFMQVRNLSRSVDNAFIVNFYRAIYAPAGSPEHVTGVADIFETIDEKFKKNRVLGQAFAQCVMQNLCGVMDVRVPPETLQQRLKLVADISRHVAQTERNLDLEP